MGCCEQCYPTKGRFPGHLQFRFPGELVQRQYLRRHNPHHQRDGLRLWTQAEHIRGGAHIQLWPSLPNCSQFPTLVHYADPKSTGTDTADQIPQKGGFPTPRW